MKNRSRSDDIPTHPLLGAHFSIAGGLEKALGAAEKYRCNAVQLFTKNATTWKERTLSEEEIAGFIAHRKKAGVCVAASHAAYLINPAGNDAEKRAQSLNALVHEMVRSGQLLLDYVVLHPGSALGTDAAGGVRRVACFVSEALAAVPESGARLLLETTAGMGSGVGHTFEQLARMLEAIGMPERTGVCLDTCHIFAAGYDIRTPEGYARTLEDFHRTVGLDRLYLLHLNDSKKGCGERVDRHAHIGRGSIGEAAFSFIMNDPRLEKTAKILETPKTEDGKDMDAANLKKLRKMVIPDGCGPEAGLTRS